MLNHADEGLRVVDNVDGVLYIIVSMTRHHFAAPNAVLVLSFLLRLRSFEMGQRMSKYPIPTTFELSRIIDSGRFKSAYCAS